MIQAILYFVCHGVGQRKEAPLVRLPTDQNGCFRCFAMGVFTRAADAARPTLEPWIHVRKAASRHQHQAGKTEHRGLEQAVPGRIEPLVRVIHGLHLSPILAGVPRW